MLDPQIEAMYAELNSFTADELLKDVHDRAENLHKQAAEAVTKLSPDYFPTESDRQALIALAGQIRIYVHVSVDWLRQLSVMPPQAGRD